MQAGMERSQGTYAAISMHLFVESGASLKLLARMLVVLLMMVASAYLQDGDVDGDVDVDVEGVTMDKARGPRRLPTAPDLDKMLQRLRDFIADKGCLLWAAAAASFHNMSWHKFANRQY